MAENKQLSTVLANRPQIKVCGLTRVAEAQACVDAGVDAIGLVFYPPSSRFVKPKRAARIAAAASGQAATVGVFVDETYDTIMRTTEHCSLQAVQLHRRFFWNADKASFRGAMPQPGRGNPPATSTGANRSSWPVA
jgi:phosphoribosylanthranilate isomerase